jgi:hypothetical protein
MPDIELSLTNYNGLVRQCLKTHCSASICSSILSLSVVMIQKRSFLVSCNHARLLRFSCIEYAVAIQLYQVTFLITHKLFILAQTRIIHDEQLIHFHVPRIFVLIQHDGQINICIRKGILCIYFCIH